MQLIATQLQPSQNNTFSTTIQLHDNCRCHVDIINYHPSIKFDTWHYEKNWT